MGEWQRVPCSTNSCLEWWLAPDGRYRIRSTTGLPGFSADELDWLALAITAGDLDQDTP
jgi:hypothetical protein